MKNKDYIWESNRGEIHICDMSSNHIINTINSINDMVKKGSLDNYPPQYDNMYKVLNERGIDTDLVIDSWWKN